VPPSPLKIKPESLAAHLRERLLPVYLISGDDPLLTGEAVDAVRLRAGDHGVEGGARQLSVARELLARVRAILRRSAAAKPNRSSIKHLSVAGIELDTGSRAATCNGVELELTNVEFELLCTLMQAPGQILTREHLTESVLDRRFNPFDRSLDMHVSRLRRKLDDAAKLGDQIKTIRSVGYQLALPPAPTSAAVREP